MGQILLVNPITKKRTTRKTKRKGLKMAAQKRNARGRFVKTKRPASAQKRKTARPRRKTVTRVASPSRKRRRTRATTTTTTTRTRTYKRNPIKRGLVNNTIMPAVHGALGGIALDAVYGYAPIPANLKIGNLRHIAKSGIAIVIGMLVQNFVKGAAGANMAKGALTVTLHDAIKEMGNNAGLKLGDASDFTEIGYYSPGQPAITDTDDDLDEMGVYLDGSDDFIELSNYSDDEYAFEEIY